MMRRSPPVFRSVMLLLLFVLSAFICYIILTGLRLQIKDGKYQLSSTLIRRESNKNIAGLDSEDWLILIDKYSRSGLYLPCKESIDKYLYLNNDTDAGNLYFSAGENFYNNSMFREAAEFFIKAEKAGVSINSNLEELIDQSLKKAGLNVNGKEQAERKIIAISGDTVVYQEDFLSEINYRNINNSNLSPDKKRKVISKVIWKKRLLDQVEKLGINNDKKIQKHLSEFKKYYYIFKYLKLNNNSFSDQDDFFQLEQIDSLIDSYAMIQGEIEIEYIDQ